MPELPEVETVKNSLKDLIIGQEIEKVKVFYPIIKNMEISSFENELKDETFKDIKRVGKYLVFILNNHILLSHLRMEGKYMIRGQEEHTKHEHVIFTLKSGKTFRYNDVRKFGTMFLFNTTDFNYVRNQEPLKHLGLEPFDEGFNVDYLKNKFKNKRIPIKTVLLDQSIISGLGNIYVDEVCFMCGFSPLRKACDLDEADIQLIIKNSKIVLEKAIALGGTTIKSFLNAHEISGRFQNELLVHTKTICPKCNDKIIKKFVGGRGTYYCPNCQPLIKNKKLVAITGGIATGKSYISQIIKESHYVIDCDILAHEALDVNNTPYKEVIKEFVGILNEDKTINRSKLGQIVFNDEEKKERLEAIIHPYVIKRMNELIKDSNEQLIFIEVPLLYEAKLTNLFDVVIVVYLDYELQLQRLMERNGINSDYAKTLIFNQMSLDKKIKQADYIINNVDKEQSRIQTKEIIKKLEEKNEIQ